MGVTHSVLYVGILVNRSVRKIPLCLCTHVHFHNHSALPYIICTKCVCVHMYTPTKLIFLNNIFWSGTEILSEAEISTVCKCSGMYIQRFVPSLLCWQVLVCVYTLCQRVCVCVYTMSSMCLCACIMPIRVCVCVYFYTYPLCCASDPDIKGGEWSHSQEQISCQWINHHEVKFEIFPLFFFLSARVYIYLYFIISKEL